MNAVYHTVLHVGGSTPKMCRQPAVAEFRPEWRMKCVGVSVRVSDRMPNEPLSFANWNFNTFLPSPIHHILFSIAPASPLNFAALHCTLCTGLSRWIYNDGKTFSLFIARNHWSKIQFHALFIWVAICIGIWKSCFSIGDQLMVRTQVSKIVYKSSPIV